MPSIQFDLEDENTIDALYDLMGQIAKRNRKRVGIGTVAKLMLELLLSHPEMTESLLAEYARKADTAIRAFHADQSSGRPLPKGKTTRQG